MVTDRSRPTWIGEADAIAQMPKRPSLPRTLIGLVAKVVAVLVPWFHLTPALVLVVVLGPVGLVLAAVVYGLAWWQWRHPLTVCSPLQVSARLVGRPGPGSGIWEWHLPAEIPMVVPSYRGLVRWSWITSRMVWRFVTWKRLCARAAVVLPVDRLHRAPKLCRLDVVTAGWAITHWHYLIRPLAPQQPDTWGTLEGRLLSVIDGVDSFHHPEPNRPSRMRLTVLTRPMPDVLEVGTDRTLDDLDHARELPGDIVLGESLHGGPIVLRPDEPGRSMVLLTGAQGSGKSNTINGVIFQAGRRGDRITILNPKGDGHYDWCTHFASVATDRLARFAALLDVLAEMRRRASVLKALGLPSHLALTDEQRTEYRMTGRLLFVVDEVATFVNTKGDPNHKVTFPHPGTGELAEIPEGQLYKWAMEGLGELTSMGRALGVTVLLTPQHAVADNLGPNGLGSTIKANVNARLAVGRIEPEAMRILFGSNTLTNRQAAALSTLRHGRTVYSGLCNADDIDASAKSGQLYLWPDHLLRQWSAGWEHPDVVDFDHQLNSLPSIESDHR